MPSEEVAVSLLLTEEVANPGKETAEGGKVGGWREWGFSRCL